ncbi:hypothetical protein L7F22_055486 [Adiantum nelumboides]|nr:hypothetical protein [Adiantum nelumboides]
MLGMFRLIEDAKLWWKQHCKDNPTSSHSWEGMKQAVKERYLPLAHQALKINELYALRQLGLTLEEYYSKFVSLRRYTFQMTMEQQIAQFCQGLNRPLSTRLEAMRPTSIQDALIRAKPFATEKAQEEAAAAQAAPLKEKEIIDLSSTIEYLKKVEREKHLEEQQAAQLAREKIKEALNRKAEGPILEPSQSSPKRPRQEDEEELEHIQADPPPSSPIVPLAPPSSPITPFPPASTPRTPPSQTTLDPPRSPPPPVSHNNSNNILLNPLKSHPPKIDQMIDQWTELQKKKNRLTQLNQSQLTAQHEAKVKQLEQKLTQAKAELELQRQQNEALNKDKEAMGTLAPTSHISQAETHVHVQLPYMPDMPDLPGTSHHDEEYQGPTLEGLGC